jgi:hypothetical protein
MHITFQVKGYLLLELLSKQHWVRKFPGALPSMAKSEKLIFVDASGQVTTCGADFSEAERQCTYPVKIYLAHRPYHTANPEYLKKVLEYVNYESDEMPYQSVRNN